MYIAYDLYYFSSLKLVVYTNIFSYIIFEGFRQ